MDNVTILIDQNTYKQLLEIAYIRNTSVVNEISYALRNHIDKEKQKIENIKENKQLLCEG